jgi:hypothetical protein
MGLCLDATGAMANETTPSPRRVTRGEPIGPNFINVVPARLRVAESFPRLVDGVGVETEYIAADSEHGRSPLRMPGPDAYR